MKRTTGILVCTLAVGMAWAQNPQILQNTRTQLNAVQENNKAASNEALGIKQTPAKSTAAKPAVVSSKPVAPSKAVSAAAKPTVTATKPATTAAKSTVTASKPAATPVKVSAAASKPTATPQKSSQGQRDCSEVNVGSARENSFGGGSAGEVGRGASQDQQGDCSSGSKVRRALQGEETSQRGCSTETWG